jgi:hypothetical protein
MLGVRRRRLFHKLVVVALLFYALSAVFWQAANAAEDEPLSANQC